MCDRHPLKKHSKMIKIILRWLIAILFCGISAIGGVIYVATDNNFVITFLGFSIMVISLAIALYLVLK